jgi:PleD family two-component response regulator
VRAWLDQVHQRRHEERSGGVTLQLVSQTPRRPVILLIDDDRTVHSIVARVLAGFDGTLLHAYDGATGLQMAHDVQPELVIADISPMTTWRSRSALTGSAT